MSPEKKKSHVHVKLGQLFSTAICGNDILSSALYVSGIAAIFAGIYAPLVLLLIGGVLYLYKSVYTEVVEALPINGGAYNCLLNGTSKTFAAVAGILTLLSYIATAVISAKVGIEYLHTVFHFIPVIPTTIGLLLLFALLVISGLKDSAKVATGIFIFHIVSLVAFVVIGLIYFLNGHSLFAENLANTSGLIIKQGGLWKTLFLAFSASLLGVSGFESSANFVEEQKAGVFRKTLRNMLIGVAIFNPLISLVTLNSMPLEAIGAAKDFLLADAAQVIGGDIFKYVIVADAFLVLSGAVLTSFVGIGGLVYRMAADGCLPGFLTKVNSKGSYPRIIVGFFLLCSSILIITKGELLSLAGVYTIAFLSVMSAFAFGNLILKESRTELKRTYSAPVLFVVFAFVATFSGIIGNILIDGKNFEYFAMYFIPAILVVFILLNEDKILKVALRLTRGYPAIQKKLYSRFGDIVDGKFVVFIHHIERLHSILDYVNRNETGWNVTLVHCSTVQGKSTDHNFEEIKETLPKLKRAGVFPHLNIELVFKDKPFGPELIDEIEKEYGVRKNRMLIGAIHHFHPYDYADLGGVRIIF